MSQKHSYEINATVREEQGKGASRRLRRAGLVPAIVYGGKDEPLAIAIKQDELAKNAKHDSFFSQIINLKIEGKGDVEVIVRDVQHHVYKPLFMHFDFQRIVKGQEITTTVPFNFVNEETAHGVKMQGGIVSKLLTNANIICAPKDLPEAIDVDLAALELGQTLHLSDIKLPKGVRFAGDTSQLEQTAVVHIVHSGSGAEETTEASE